MAASQQQQQQQQWAGQGEQFDLLPGVGDDADFGDFLDLNLDQEFPMFDLDAEHAHQQQGDIQDVLDPQLLQDAEQHRPQVPSSHDRNNPNFALAAAEQQGNPMYSHNANGHYELMQQHGSDKHTMFAPQGIVPPTPNSSQMYSDRAGYMRRMDAQALAGVEQHYQMRKENMNFTPLLSPAATPHDSQSQMVQEIVPGAYFSPLTSPAIQGQPHSGNHTPQFPFSGRHSNSSTTTSPIDVDVDMLGDPAISRPTATRKSSRRRPSTSTAASARARQSQTVRARGSKRKGTVSASSKVASETADQTQKSQIMSRVQADSLSVPPSQSNSETGSISPEPLSEAIMGPPPKPRSAMQSPAILAENDQMRGGVPATPASLMRIANGKLSGSQSNTASPVSMAQDSRGRNASSLEDLTLPEAAVSPGGAATPYVSARPTPKLGPLNTSTVSTPLASPVTPSAGQKRSSTIEPKPGRGKKRNSTSFSDGRPPPPSNGNALISPALRPKISPSIKPLQPSSSGPTSAASSMPATPMTISEQTAHLLLASKSNYQHLVDGTNVNVPGLEYPESLSTGLTSKRTSHKIAEQGRRNRINVALAEMGRLLPPELRSGKSPTIGALEAEASTAGQKKANGGAAAPGAVDVPPTSGSSAANAGNSKAATVESAIVYIRMLQQQAEDRDAAMREKEKEIEQLRRRLDASGTRAAADEEEEGEKRSRDRPGDTDVAVTSSQEGSAEEQEKDSNMDVDGRTEDG